MNHRAWNVFLDGKKIDTVFCHRNDDRQTVLKSLINHDGYDPRIEVKPDRRISKYLYGFKLYLNYGQGWEYEVFEEKYSEIKAREKEYQENSPAYPTKITSGRETNPAYSE